MSIFLAPLDFSEYSGPTTFKNVNFSSIGGGLPMQQEPSLLGLSLGSKMLKTRKWWPLLHRQTTCDRAENDIFGLYGFQIFRKVERSQENWHFWKKWITWVNITWVIRMHVIYATPWKNLVLQVTVTNEQLTLHLLLLTVFLNTQYTVPLFCPLKYHFMPIHI